MTSFRGDWLDILLWLANVAAFLVCGYRAFFRGKRAAAIMAGVFKSLLVVRSTHAASHFSLSCFPRLNRFVYWLNMSMLGDTPAQWTAKHVLSHHIDCNIDYIDEDSMYPIKRVLPNLDWHSFHSFQLFYMPLMYLLIYLPWTLSHTVKLALGYLSGQIYEGTVKVRLQGWMDHAETVSACLLGWLNLVLPLFTLRWMDAQCTWFQVWTVVALYQIASGAWFSLQFAVNHEVAESVEHSGSASTVWSEQRDWGMHQLLTSHNYSPDSPLALHLSGGLNYQIEHHLFPAVHYKWYPALSTIVRQTAKEFGVRYEVSASFWDALVKHASLLRQMSVKPNE